MSIGLTMTIQGDEQVERLLAALLQPQWDDLLDQIGGTVVAQTQERIADDKSDPQGEPWKAWSGKYAQTRHGGHSLLKGNNDLLNSINHQVIGMSVEVGSHLVYAGIHQKGGEIKVTPKMRGYLHYRDIHLKGSTSSIKIPARPYLGISDDNRDELEEIISEWFSDLIKRNYPGGAGTNLT